MMWLEEAPKVAVHGCLRVLCLAHRYESSIIGLGLHRALSFYRLVVRRMNSQSDI